MPANKTEIRCRWCKKTFVTQSGRRRHEKIHNGHYSQIVCNICDQTFCDTVSLNQHIVRHQQKKKSYSCDFCKKEFYFKKDLCLHQIVCIKNYVTNEHSTSEYEAKGVKFITEQERDPNLYQSGALEHYICRPVLTTKQLIKS